MKDVLLIPDSRSRQAQSTRNRLLEQNMKHLAAIQRQAVREKKGDLDALIVAITRLAASITQVVRLHHQIWREDAVSDDALSGALRLVDFDESDNTEKMP
jgi:malate/lactate dehydrogenase